VELLVAMTISLVIIAAASGVYVVSGQAFSTADTSSQLQDSARFGTYILRRMVQQTGYEDYSEYSTGNSRANSILAWAGLPTCVQSDICGFHNLAVPVASIISGSGSSPGAGASSGTLPGPYYTDTVVVQFQGQSKVNLTTKTLTATPDGSIIDCYGNGVPSNTTSPPTRAMSALYVKINSVTNEPELQCSARDRVTGAGIAPVPLVKGVEVFKVMYEIGNNVDVNASGALTGTPDRFRWVRADEIPTVASSIVKPAPLSALSNDVNAWQNVVAVRFGMVIRGEPGTATAPATAQTLYPLGRDLATSGDPATNYVPPLDTRLRRVVTFTVHLRNRTNAFALTP